MSNRIEVARTYDQIADEYVAHVADELRSKPFDCEVLGRFADAVREAGPVCDLGCGPGHVARYLHERGVDVCGVDLSEGMLERTRRAHPGIAFRQGDMTALEVSDGTWAGVAAFYSIIHLPREDLGGALREIRRALRPGGLLLLAFHVGTDIVHREEWWGHRVSIDTVFYGAAEMDDCLRAVGFVVDEIRERDPYPEIEYPSRRAYVLASKHASR